MSELTEREIADMAADQPLELHPRLQRLTLEIVLRAVFGLEQGAQLDRLRELLTTGTRVRREPDLAAAFRAAHARRTRPDGSFGTTR